MKFITVRDLKIKTGEVWKILETERDIVVTSNGKPIAVLSNVNENNVEISLASLRRSRAAVAANKLQQQSLEKRTDKLSDKEIESEIRAVRKGRRS